MKLIYVEEIYLKEIMKEIDNPKFLEENKLVILSSYPYTSCTNIEVYEQIKNIPIESDVMFLSLGNLAHLISKKKGIEILNYGLGFQEEDLLKFPLVYYQEKENKKVDAISFHYQEFRKSPYFSIDRLNNYLNKNGIKNKELLKFQKIDFGPEEKENVKVKDDTPRKVMFVYAERVFYSGYNGEDFENIEGTVKEYLEDGNILVLLTYTGNHYGYPFSIDIANILDTKNYEEQYRKMLDFFRSLDLFRDQVSNFKIEYTGINFMGDSYPFGFSYRYNNRDQELNYFTEIYLDYMKEKGYNISDVYWLERPFDKKDSENVHWLDFDVLNQATFNRIVKSKVLG